MSKLIQLPTDYRNTKAYRDSLERSLSRLGQIEIDLVSIMVDLATTGKWKKWSEEFPKGEMFEFTEDMFRETGDKNLDSLSKLLDEVLKAREFLAGIREQQAGRIED